MRTIFYHPPWFFSHYFSTTFASVSNCYPNYCTTYSIIIVPIRVCCLVPSNICLVSRCPFESLSDGRKNNSTGELCADGKNHLLLTNYTLLVVGVGGVGEVKFPPERTALLWGLFLIWVDTTSPQTSVNTKLKKIGSFCCSKNSQSGLKVGKIFESRSFSNKLSESCSITIRPFDVCFPLPPVVSQCIGCPGL